MTLLFTDIEGSTALLHELGAAYADVLAEHRNTLRDVFGRHGGPEVDTPGDAFFHVFRDAADALRPPPKHIWAAAPQTTVARALDDLERC